LISPLLCWGGAGGGVMIGLRKIASWSVNERGVEKQTLFEGSHKRPEFVCFSRRNEHSGNFSAALIFFWFFFCIKAK